jgi:hypothetical protein
LIAGAHAGRRLVFVDGLPGSGKSTTTELVAGALQQRGIPCRLLREREADHPLNVGGDLHPSGSTTGAAMFARYDVRSFVAESLARWAAFAAEAAASERVDVLDGYPFQNSVRVLLQMDPDPATVATYETAVYEQAARLGPVLIYLDAGDPERAIRTIAEQRGAAWTEYATSVITQCPYANARSLEGMDGMVAILRAYKRLIDESVARLPFPRLVLTGCAGRWPACHASIRAFLGLEGSA